MSTELTSELTHFNLVIRLGKVQQLAFLFCTFFENSRGSGRPRDPSDLLLFQREIVRNSQKLHFSYLQLQFLTQYMARANEGNRHVLFLQVWSLWYLVR